MAVATTADSELYPGAPSLPAETADGRARYSALRAFVQRPRFATTAVSYHSRGVVLVIGEQARAVPVAMSLKAAGLQALVLQPAAAPEGGFAVSMGEEGVVLAEGVVAEFTGYLGHFRVSVRGRHDSLNLAREMGVNRDDVDLVLDLGPTFQLALEVPPPGYFAAADRAAIDRAVSQLPDMVGEYEKPKYFEFNADICAHSARGLIGCSRCIDACPTAAIRSLDKQIEVDPYLCQGGGSCATVCPTGAIRYAFPPASRLLDGMRVLLRSFRECGGTRPALLFYSAWGRSRVEAWAPQMPESVIPIEVEDVGGVGLEVWLSALAYGAHQVWLLCTEGTPASISRALDQQLQLARELLAGMGYEAERVTKLVASGAPPAPVHEHAVGEAAGYAGMDEKRTNIRSAMDHLFRFAPKRKRVHALSVPTPFGEVRVDRDACTLCMSCVAVCPSGALSDGEDIPKLTFIEGACVQCGLCAGACPENAVKLFPRYAYDAELRDRPRILNEEEPFHCVRCGKPFATHSMMKRMREKLEGHWMFSNASQRRRLEMCEDCRIEDIYLQDGGLEVYDKPSERGPNSGS